MEQDGQDDDDALVARAARGDREAFARLVSRHGSPLAAVAHRMLGRQAEVDDVVQEALLRLWRQAPAWKPGGAKLSTWLYRVTANLCIDRLRRPVQMPLDEIADPHDPAPGPERGLAATAAAREVERALQALSPRQRLAIVLCHYEGQSNIDAAAAMGLSVEALESLLARGRRALRLSLAENRHWLIAALADGGTLAASEARHG